LEQVTPSAIIVLDLFRDQLDRYGELDTIAKKWSESFKKLPSSTKLILNADDPLIAYLGNLHSSESISFFGLSKSDGNNSAIPHAADSIYCPRCSNKLNYKSIFYSHLGIWKCPHCKLERPIPNLSNTFFPLIGMYNKYNTLAASLTARVVGIPNEKIESGLHFVIPAFGRQEKLKIKDKNVQIFLSKNPTGFNENLKTIFETTVKPTAIFVLNDRIPDGRDISWIWDISMEEYVDKFNKIFISGDRVYDMALRVKYSMQFPKNDTNSKIQIYEDLNTAIQKALDQTPSNETLYILPTYSAMLEVRKILTGKKIL